MKGTIVNKFKKSCLLVALKASLNSNIADWHCVSGRRQEMLFSLRHGDMMKAAARHMKPRRHSEKVESQLLRVSTWHHPQPESSVHLTTLHRLNTQNNFYFIAISHVCIVVEATCGSLRSRPDQAVSLVVECGTYGPGYFTASQGVFTFGNNLTPIKQSVLWSFNNWTKESGAGKNLKDHMLWKHGRAALAALIILNWNIIGWCKVNFMTVC